MKHSMAKSITKPAAATKADRLDPDPSAQRVREGLIALLIIGAVIVFFWPVSNATFLTYDDLQNIAHNPRMNPPTWASIPLYWKSPYLYLYIPLTYMIWTLLAMVSRTAKPDEIGLRIDATSFHTLNLLLHAVAALVLYRLLRRLTRKPWAAAAGALLFALHPIQVEPVAWATGLKDVLSGLLSLIALWQYVTFVQASQDDIESELRFGAIWHYAIATIAFVLALLSKPSAAMVPIAAAVIHVLLLPPASKKVPGTFSHPGLKRFLTPFLSSSISLVPWLLLSAGCLLITKHAQPVRASTVMNAGALWQRPLIAADATAFYIYKLLIPWHLMPQYDHTPQAAIARGWIYWAWIVPMTVLVIGLFYRKRAPWALASFALLVAGILPVSGLVPFAFEELSLVADRYLYFAMIGPAIALAYALAQTKMRWAGILASIWLLILGILALIQSTYWHNTRTLFEYEMTVNPNSDIAYNNLANYYNFRGSAEDQEKALGYAQTMVQKFPKLADGYFVEGSTLAALGRHDEAIAALRHGLQLEPNNMTALGNLASSLADKGQLDEAMKTIRQVLDFSPEDADAHRNYGGMLYVNHRDAEAQREFEAAIRYNPEDYQAHTALARLLAEKGQTQQAAEHYQAALSINPQYAPALDGFARLRGF